MSAEHEGSEENESSMGCVSFQLLSGIGGMYCILFRETVAVCMRRDNSSLTVDRLPIGSCVFLGTFLPISKAAHS